jgi:hypothetical protein
MKPNLGVFFILEVLKNFREVVAQIRLLARSWLRRVMTVSCM